MGLWCHGLLGSLASLLWVCSKVKYHVEGKNHTLLAAGWRGGKERKEDEIKRERWGECGRERSQYTFEAIYSSNGLDGGTKNPPLNFPPPPQSAISRQTNLHYMTIKVPLKARQCGNVSWYHHCERQHGDFSEKKKVELGHHHHHPAQVLRIHQRDCKSVYHTGTGTSMFTVSLHSSQSTHAA